MDAPSPPAPATPSLPVDARILRSPSRESVTTELSMLSVSSAEPARIRLLGFHTARSVSPNPDSDRPVINRPPGIPEVQWCDEENDVIRSCAALSAMLGLQKSFSTSDIAQIPNHPGLGPGATPLGSPFAPLGPLGDAFSPGCLRAAVSELSLSPAQKNSYLLCQSKLENTSRSCSTWVAVGDAATSQLPSPHGGHPSAAVSQHLTCISPADLVRSVNKKVRQNYIRRKLLTTYKALERFSLSKCNLDTLGVAAAAAQAATAARAKKGAETPTATSTPSQGTSFLAVPGAAGGGGGGGGGAPRSHSQSGLNTLLKAVNKSKTLTVGDVERERGKPLSKYDRNIMIFNWLHQLEPEDCECYAEPV
nr:PREDICTED: uncharacterized protein LOC109041550 [Bemisia tabaci]